MNARSIGDIYGGSHAQAGSLYRSRPGLPPPRCLVRRRSFSLFRFAGSLLALLLPAAWALKRML